MHLFVFYAPESHLDSVKNALFECGAGKGAGDYLRQRIQTAFACGHGIHERQRRQHPDHECRQLGDFILLHGGMEQ